MAFATSPLMGLVDSFRAGDTRQSFIQLAAIAVALVFAWLIARSICKRVGSSQRWKFGKGEFERVATPFFAVALVWAAKTVLDNRQDTYLTQVVLTLLVAYLVVRTSMYVLGHIIHEGGFQHAVIRIVKWVAWVGALLYLTGYLPEVLDALDSHGFTFGKNKTEVTLLDIAKGVAALFLTVTFALWLSRVTESRVMAAETMEVTTRVVVTKVVRIATLFIAIFIALPMAGIDVTTLSIFGGALGVGLGFGLQKIASNYVSGFIVLLDRSLRIGDVVTVDGKRGEVKAIESRYTVIKGGDGVESIIPNEKLITESVNHHTYSDPKISMVMGVWITYESDVEKACDLLAEIAKGHKRVIADPPSVARVKQLGDHGIELELTVWISDPALGEGDLKSEVFKEILRGFRSAGIEIPYPRRDIRMIATPEMPQSPALSRG